MIKNWISPLTTSCDLVTRLLELPFSEARSLIGQRKEAPPRSSSINFKDRSLDFHRKIIFHSFLFFNLFLNFHSFF